MTVLWMKALQIFCPDSGLPQLLQSIFKPMGGCSSAETSLRWTARLAILLLGSTQMVPWTMLLGTVFREQMDQSVPCSRRALEGCSLVAGSRHSTTRRKI